MIAVPLHNPLWCCTRAHSPPFHRLSQPDIFLATKFISFLRKSLVGLRLRTDKKCQSSICDRANGKTMVPCVRHSPREQIARRMFMRKCHLINARSGSGRRSKPSNCSFAGCACAGVCAVHRPRCSFTAACSTPTTFMRKYSACNLRWCIITAGERWTSQTPLLPFRMVRWALFAAAAAEPSAHILCCRYCASHCSFAFVCVPLVINDVTYGKWNGWSSSLNRPLRTAYARCTFNGISFSSFFLHNFACLFAIRHLRNENLRWHRMNETFVFAPFTRTQYEWRITFGRIRMRVERQYFRIRICMGRWWIEATIHNWSSHGRLNSRPNANWCSLAVHSGNARRLTQIKEPREWYCYFVSLGSVGCLARITERRYAPHFLERQSSTFLSANSFIMQPGTLSGAQYAQ